MKKILRSGHREIEFFSRYDGIEPLILGGEKPKDRLKVQPGGGSGLAPPKKVDFKLRVVEDATDQPIQGVEIILTRPDGWKTAKTTDFDGMITLKAVEASDSFAASCDLTQRQLKNTLAYVRMGGTPGDSKRLLAYQETDEKSDFRIAHILIHKVKTGESIDSIAKANGMTWQELSMFNWGTSVPKQINDHLREQVGCTKKTADGNNYLFDDSDDPGLMFIPKKWREGALGGGEVVNVVRIRKIEEAAVAWLAVKMFFHQEPMADLTVTFHKRGTDGHPGMQIGPKFKTDENGEAKLDNKVLVGRYVCQIENQPPAGINTVEDRAKPFPLVLPIGRPYFDFGGDAEFQ